MSQIFTVHERLKRDIVSHVERSPEFKHGGKVVLTIEINYGTGPVVNTFKVSRKEEYEVRGHAS